MVKNVRGARKPSPHAWDWRVWLTRLVHAVLATWSDVGNTTGPGTSTRLVTGVLEHSQCSSCARNFTRNARAAHEILQEMHTFQWSTTPAAIETNIRLCWSIHLKELLMKRQASLTWYITWSVLYEMQSITQWRRYHGAVRGGVWVLGLGWGTGLGTRQFNTTRRAPAPMPAHAQYYMQWVYPVH